MGWALTHNHKAKKNKCHGTLSRKRLSLHSYRHVVYAPSSVNQYGSSLFPGVSDAIFAATEWGGSWDSVREQLDLVRVHMNYASQIMARFT